MAEHKQKIIIVCGATATKKSSLSIFLAGRLNGEIVSADSMQIYRHLDIGTAKTTAKQQQGIAHHMQDVIGPDCRFSLSQYLDTARPIIHDIAQRGKVCIVCGGTGLYIDAVRDGRKLADFEIREETVSTLASKTPEELYEELCRKDPTAAKKIHKNNIKRIIRALTLCYDNSTIFSKASLDAIPKEPPFEILILRTEFKDRDMLYNAIDKRVDDMLLSGLLSEAFFVFENKKLFTTAAAAIGYKEFFDYFEGESSLDECTKKLKQATHNYAKRQITWFKRYSDAVSIYVDDGDVRYDKAIKIAGEFLL